MVQSYINFNLALALIGVCSALGTAALLARPAAAAAPVEFAQPSVEFGIDLSDLNNGAASLMPTECNQNDEMCGTTSFKVPIQLNVSNASKYNVSIWAETADLTSTTTSKTIPSVSSETTLSQLSNNWGYRWTFGSDKEDRTNPYIAMPTTSTTLRLGGATTTISSADDLSASPVDINLPSPSTDNRYLTLGFGVNIDGDTPAGTYKNKIHIAATASPLKVTLFNLETMQQMTSDICANTTTPPKTASKTDTTFEHHGDKNYVPEVTLKDTRDGKTYLVRKLADGNCWMSQNLAFDFVDDQSLPDLIDGSANPNKYYTGRTKDEEGNFITSGDILVTNAFKLTSTNTDLDDLGTDGEWTPNLASVPVFKTQTSQGNSTTHPWADDGSDGMRSFSSFAAYPTSNYSVAGAIIGTYNGEGDDALQNRTFTIGDTGEPYQKYGNFYNWTAATLGTSLNTTTGEGGNPEATASICPKGWRLPQSTNIVDKITPIANTNDPDYGKMNKSFLNLIRNYSNPLVGEENAIAGVASFGNTYASVTSLSSGAAGINAYNQIAEFPLNFLHTGYYNRSNGSVGAYALDGDWWSSTASSATHAYHLATWGPGRLIAQNGSHRGIGFTVRCVAR